MVRTVRLAVMGAGGVGKSALTLRFTHGSYVADYDPTVEDQYSAHIVLDGAAISLDILDTAGQEEYASLRSTFIDEVDGVMLVFSIVDDYTLDEISSIYNEVVDSNPGRDIPFLLVGNKSDLESERAVTRMEARHLAATFGDCAYLETSAKTNASVKEAFEAIVRSAVGALSGDALSSANGAAVYGIAPETNPSSSESKRGADRDHYIDNTGKQQVGGDGGASAIFSADGASTQVHNGDGRGSIDNSVVSVPVSDGPSDLNALRARAGLGRPKRRFPCSIL